MKTPRYNTQTVPTATAARLGAVSAKRLMAVVLFGGSTDSKVEFFNAASESGTAILSLNCLANTTTGVDLTPLGGLAFSTSIWCKPTGTGALAYCWYDGSAT